ncbi:MAG: ATP-binding cassette domain-containing protein, partial [Acutalibacteraceae bacterium]|nr:ATP-binding cassette domain-containing protein [Acutalibacteraceae bacterium]
DNYQQTAYQNDGYQEQPAYPVQDNYQQTAYQNDGYQEQPAYPVQDDYQQPTYPTQPAPRRRPRTAPQRNWSAEPEQSVQQARPAQRNWSAEPEQPVQQARSAQRNWSAEPEQPVQQARPAQRNWSAEPEHSEPSAPSAPSVSSADTVQESTTTPPKITGEIVISAKNIHKTFGKGETAQVVLDGANLDIEKGSFVSLMGESGTGKSTLLYLIGGLDRDFTGDIFVSGKNIANLSDNQLSEIRCKKMGFVFQFYNLAANLTIEDNILLPLEMSGRKMADYREKYKEILEITGLENKVKSYPSQLSGGQQQRAAIARAVLGDPEIILADEPTGNLDAASGAEIMELFSRLNKERGVTILQVTHSAEAASYSSRIVTLKNRIISG